MDAKVADSSAVEIELPKNDQESFNYGKNAPPGYEKIEAKKVFAPTSSNYFRSIIYANEATRKLMNIGEIFLCSVSITCILIILMAIPVTMISIGVIHINNCKVQKLIPIWLIILGCLAIIKNVSTLIQRIKNRDDRGSSKLVSLFDSFLALIIILWFIAGQIWTYGNYSKADTKDPESDNYCNPLVLYFAFWIINAVYILILTACIIFCCTICLTIFIPSKK